ncbi:MAG: peptide chain release factor N(5)-glutamine methyltransferase [Simkaniaceae bacterium]|nr:peptide chain release factor N(5)-glutamine methyltransferase [Simkaniaceae bacterium]
MKTIRQTLQQSKSLLDQFRIPSSRRIAEEIVASILQISRMELYLQFDRHVGTSEWRKCLNLIERHTSGEPLEYILQIVDFYGCEIEVTPSVLIPRSETEILLEKVCGSVVDRPAARALDLCTGSGCLGLGLKKHFPEMKVILSDISEECIKLARRNAKRNGLSVGIACGNLLAPFNREKFDLVVCNPPYISKAAYEGLESSVKDFEPRLALVGGETGLEIYQKLSISLPAHLNPGAKVFFEIGFDQGESMREIFSSSHWKSVKCEKDWAGHDRFFSLEYQ